MNRIAPPQTREHIETSFNRHRLLTLAVGLLLTCTCSPLAAQDAAPPDLAAAFQSPPPSAKPLVWWHWINGNVTKEGIEADLADMKRVGIAGAQMLDVSIYMPPGPVRYGSDLWHEHVQFAIRTADKLGLEFMMMNSPGWSASGGPWVNPERSMKKLVWSEVELEGGRRIDEILPYPITRLGVYHDVAVVAVPGDTPEANLLRTPRLKAAKASENGSIAASYDGIRSTSVPFDAGDGRSQLVLRFDFEELVAVSELDLLLTGLGERCSLKGSIEVASLSGEFREACKFNFPDHEGTPVQLQVPFEAVKTNVARVTIQVASSDKLSSCALAEVGLGHPLRLEDWTQKIKMAEASLQRPRMSEPPQKLGAIRQDAIIDLTRYLDSDGRFQGDLPPGRWSLLRFGYTSTGSMNHPAVPEGHGLEIDKLDSDAVMFYFDRSLGRVIKEAGPLTGKTFTGILFDSFEGGPQNWTESFPQQFAEHMGYELTRYLPIVTGRIVESPAFSEAFLHDFRTAVEELIAKNYFGSMQQLAHQHGLSIYAEAQGGPLNPVSCNEYTDVPMNEFWLPDTTPREPRIKLVASTANLLGHKVVAAEAFTSKPEDDSWRNSPATLKRAGDYAFTAGINRYILHYYAHQPVTEAAPGFTLGRYGMHFGRLNTWWPYAGEWLDYVARCQFLLQQGHTVADVCFLLNEDLGYGFPSSMLDIPAGYDFDICYPRHVAVMEFKEGAIVRPHNRSYRLLVLPRAAWATDTITLKKLRDLVNAGASILGEPPVALAGLSDHLESKDEFRDLVSAIWRGIDGHRVQSAPLGEGTVFRGMTVADCMKEIDAQPDVAWPRRHDNGEFKFIHRRHGEADIYFVFNHSDLDVEAVMEFRSCDRTPELWNPVTGTQVDAPVFTSNKEGTAVPLQLEPYGSMFVVFRSKLPDRWPVSVAVAESQQEPSVTPHVASHLELYDGQLLADDQRLVARFSDGAEEELSPTGAGHVSINGPWEVVFKDGRGAPEHLRFESLTSWSEHSNTGVKYYSGTAEYRTGFELDSDFVRTNSVILLDLGKVAEIVEVSLNGHRVGVAWKPPFRLNVTRWLRAGRNELVVTVANQWVNRMIGDEKIPVDYEYKVDGNKFTRGALEQLPTWLYSPAERSSRKRESFSTWKHYAPDSALLPSGLLGPVTLERRSPILPALQRSE